MTNKQINNGKSGTLYGVAFNFASDADKDISNICKLTSNTDERCSAPEKYMPIGIVSKIGFADGSMGAIAILEKATLKRNKSCYFATSDSCTYYKVTVEPGKFATADAIASNPGEGKCKWSGLNGAGGTVCPAYNWDYKKDNQVAVKFF